MYRQSRAVSISHRSDISYRREQSKLKWLESSSGQIKSSDPANMKRRSVSYQQRQ
jgi:hypothetical protein